jgi:hypothetical protein
MRKVRAFFRWLIIGDGPKFNKSAKDGDKDGKVQDGTIWERPASKPKAKAPAKKKPSTSTTAKKPAAKPKKK